MSDPVPLAVRLREQQAFARRRRREQAGVASNMRRGSKGPTVENPTEMSVPSSPTTSAGSLLQDLVDAAADLPPDTQVAASPEAKEGQGVARPDFQKVRLENMRLKGELSTLELQLGKTKTQPKRLGDVKKPRPGPGKAARLRAMRGSAEFPTDAGDSNVANSNSSPIVSDDERGLTLSFQTLRLQHLTDSLEELAAESPENPRFSESSGASSDDAGLSSGQQRLSLAEIRLLHSAHLDELATATTLASRMSEESLALERELQAAKTRLEAKQEEYHESVTHLKERIRTLREEVGSTSANAKKGHSKHKSDATSGEKGEKAGRAAASGHRKGDKDARERRNSSGSKDKASHKNDKKRSSRLKK
jgi:hypothetical protein